MSRHALIAVAVLLAGLALASPARAQTFLGFTGVPLLDYSEGGVAVPNVVGEADSAAADTEFEAVGLDLGAVTERCSIRPDNEVIGQDPAPGELVDLGEFIDVLVSNGVECSNSGRPGVRLRGLRMPGL